MYIRCTCGSNGGRRDRLQGLQFVRTKRVSRQSVRTDNPFLTENNPPNRSRLPCRPPFPSLRRPDNYLYRIDENVQGTTAACCGEQLKLDPPPLLGGNKPVVGAAGGDTVSVGQVNIAIVRLGNPYPEEKQQKKKQ